MVNKKYWLIVDGRKVCPEEGCIEPVPFTKPERHTARYHPNVAKMRKLIQSKKTERQPDAVPLTEDSTNSGEAANLAVTVEKEKPTQDNQMHVNVEEIEDVESPPEEQCASFVFKASEVLEVEMEEETEEVEEMKEEMEEVPTRETESNSPTTELDVIESNNTSLNEEEQPMDFNESCHPLTLDPSTVLRNSCTPYVGVYINKFKPTIKEKVVEPTLEDMKSMGFVEYVQKVLIEEKHLHKEVGVVIIRPPKEYRASASTPHIYGGSKFTPKQNNYVQNKANVYRLHAKPLHKMAFAEYLQWCDTACPIPPASIDKEALFWDRTRLLSANAVYGSDVDNSQTKFVTDLWNLSKLGDTNMLRFAEPLKNNRKILGITSCYVYFGGWGTSFPIHIENMNTPSANYLHKGAPKIWYHIHPQDIKKFMACLRKCYPADYRVCDAAYRHKSFLISPIMLTRERIRYGRVVQREGDFIVAFPGAFHWGYNEGMNCAEALNFGTDLWLEMLAADGNKVHLCQEECDYRKEDLFWSQPVFLQLLIEEHEYARKWLVVEIETRVVKVVCKKMVDVSKQGIRFSARKTTLV